MRIRIDGWVNLPKAELDYGKQAVIRDSLTIIPRRTSEFQETILPLKLYDEDPQWLRVPREWFFAHRAASHGYELAMSDGEPIPPERAAIAEKILTPEGVEKPFSLREEQREALKYVHALYDKSFGEPDAAEFKLGTSLQAPTWWGKTIWASAVISGIARKTLVLVHKEFLLDQWMKRLRTVMPGLRVGVIQGDKYDLEADVCIGMLQSLSAWAEEMKKADPEVIKGPNWRNQVRFPPAIRWMFGLIIVDEEHRMGAPTWAPVCPMFDARFRVGLTATPRRKDGCENAFFWHMGLIGFVAKEKRLIPRVKRIRTGFHLFKTPTFDPDQVGRSTIEKIMAASEPRNRLIAEQLCEAVKAGRKVILLSDKLKHLDRIAEQFQKIREAAKVSPEITIDRYVGGRSKEDLETAGRADIVFGTYQMASEGLDLPWLDTLFLAMPKSDVEQAVGRILRPFDGKKEPIVVDFIDDNIVDFRKMAARRSAFYKQFGTPVQIRRASDSAAASS